MGIKTTDLCDEFSNELSICSTQFQSYGKVKMFSGPIHTVEVLEDNVLVLDALESVPKGTVIVVNGGGSRNCALMGDRLAAIGESRGLSGIIINGCVRDTNDLKEMNLGILALDSHPLKSKKEGKGKRDVTTQFGNVTWEPGNYVYVDHDGVVLAKRKLT